MTCNKRTGWAVGGNRLVMVLVCGRNRRYVVLSECYARATTMTALPRVNTTLDPDENVATV